MSLRFLGRCTLAALIVLLPIDMSLKGKPAAGRRSR
jgi:hypothetical protein